MKYLATFLVLQFLVLNTLFAQNGDTKKSNLENNKTFFAEVGGAGILFSANYDQRFTKSRLGLGYRVGLGFTLVDKANYTGTYYNYRTSTVGTIPLGLSYIFGKNNNPNTFEVGAGTTILTSKASVLNYNEYRESNILGNFTFMYRRQPIDGGFAWRVGFTPIINNDGDIFPFVGLGLGYSFK